MDNVRGRDLTITLAGYLPGEYNDRPAPPMNAEAVPVYSHDGEHRRYFPEQAWDDKAKEGTVRIHAEADSLWIATRIAFGKKLGARPAAEHRLQWGRQLIEAMAQAVR